MSKQELADAKGPPSGGDRGGLVAAGGLAGAILASTCCVVPLLLVSVGVSGAWIGSLTALEPYKPIFALVALVLIGLGFRHVYVKPKPACEEAPTARGRNPPSSPRRRCGPRRRSSSWP